MITFKDRVDFFLRLGFGALILIGCYMVVEPFMTAIVLSAILCVVSWPVYLRAVNSFGNNTTIAASLMVTLIIVTVLIPLSFMCAIIAQQVPELIYWCRDWVRGGMQLPDWLITLPYVGHRINELFHVSINPQAISGFVQKVFDPLSKWVLSISMGVGNAIFQIALVAFISFFFYRDGKGLATRMTLILRRVSGDLSKEFAGILVSTTRSVVFGIIGTAIGQGVVAAIGFVIAGVPGWLMLSIGVCVLSVVPVGPPLVWGPVALWLFSQGSTGWAIFIVLWGVLAVSSVDNFIKPILISRGTTLPLALVFLGVFGGIMSFGMLGLVLGPILLAASIAMMKVWLASPGVDASIIKKVLGGDRKPESEGEEMAETAQIEETSEAAPSQSAATETEQVKPAEDPKSAG